MLMKILFTLSILIVYCHAAFYFPNIEYRFPSIASMATTQLNNSLIMFGGVGPTASYLNDLYELTLSNNTFNFQVLPQINRPNGTSFGQAVTVNQQSNMYLLGGVTNSTFGQTLPLQIYNYTFATNTWSAFQPTIPTALPLNRFRYSSVYDGNRSVYILGGMMNATMVFSDFYVMDTVTGQFIALPDMPIQICQQSMSYLSSGKIVVIGGTWRSNNSYNVDLLPMTSVYVYDIATMQWTNQIVSAVPGQKIPSPRANHNAVVSSDNNIYVFGGDNSIYFYNRSVVNYLNILDTATWTWNTPILNGAPPGRRSYASAGFFDSKYLVTAFGQGIDGYYYDINVYDTSINSWLISFTPEDAESGISAGIIAGVTIVSFIALVCFILLVWKFRRYIQLFFRKIHNDIWKPRTGEPLWAETTRILFQIFLLFIFVLFLTFVIRQAINSPNVVQTIQELVATIDVPDIRFCFDGIGSSLTSGPLAINCATDMGYSCNSFIKPLNMTRFTPVYIGSVGAITCFLFRASADFVLTATAGNNNGSKLTFTYYGELQSTSGRVYVSFYPKTMDPNIRTYEMYDDIPNLISSEAVSNWVVQESGDQETTGIYEIQPYSYNVVSYDLIDRQYLQPLGWNYVGFSPVTNSTPQIETYSRSESPIPEYRNLHAYMGEILVRPNSFTNIIQRDVKVYTLVNALGFVGGIFGLLIAVQAWLFGYRPRSPWGVVHRWSTGERKRSLLRGLQSKFSITNSGIPLVHPVHHRYSMTNLGNIDLNEPDDQRINRVEDRMQMLEMLFKAYYVDDEVFRSLDDASKVDNRDWLSKQKNPSNNPFEETRDYTSMAPVHDEKITTMDGISSVNNNNSDLLAQDKPLPHRFTRQDTEESESSHTHLTAHQQRSVSQYKPNTTFQMNDF